jgi:hypothetical protein
MSYIERGTLSKGVKCPNFPGKFKRHLWGIIPPKTPLFTPYKGGHGYPRGGGMYPYTPSQGDVGGVLLAMPCCQVCYPHDSGYIMWINKVIHTPGGYIMLITLVIHTPYYYWQGAIIMGL